MFTKLRKNRKFTIQIMTMAKAQMALLDTIAQLQLQLVNGSLPKTQRTIKQAELNGIKNALNTLQHIELTK
jgi:hypothetical protein